VLAGALLMAFAVVLTVNRSAPAQTRRAYPVVNVGSLHADKTRHVPRHQSHRRLKHHAVAAKFVPGSRLRMARLGVDAGITAVNTVGNVMQIPRDPRMLGWWRGGSAPGGSSGTTVIVGHINYAGVTGALAVLPEARPGDSLVIDEGPATLRYRVMAVRTYPKTSGIPADVFSQAGHARLVLITCGGPFDSDTGNYEDNIVAYATPA
jgi:LPXTG-site transpeptidase (sortase) family protein